MKQSKKRRRFETIINSDHYKSIILLTWQFDKGNGLRQMHYRWCLIKNHDNIVQTYFVKEMENFFKENKSPIAFYGIECDCITSKSNLSNFLNKLVEDYKLLEKNENGYVPTYSLSSFGKRRLEKHYLTTLINICPPDAIKKITDYTISLFPKDLGKHL